MALADFIHTKIVQFVMVILLFSVSNALAEESGKKDLPYPGITDPFGEPFRYRVKKNKSRRKKGEESVEYRPADFRLGFDIGAGIFTGGLGATTAPSFQFGARLTYFVTPTIGIEAAAHYGSFLDSFNLINGTLIEIDTILVPLTLGLIYQFDREKASDVVTIANPYFIIGGGAYFRAQSVVTGASAFREPDFNTSQFGLFIGAGIEFNIYQYVLYLGVDVRYHLIFFSDEESTLSGQLEEGSRAGDYFTPSLTLTYNF